MSQWVGPYFSTPTGSEALLLIVLQGKNIDTYTIHKRVFSIFEAFVLFAQAPVLLQQSCSQTNTFNLTNSLREALHCVYVSLVPHRISEIVYVVTLRNAIISRYTRKRRHHVCPCLTPRNVTGQQSSGSQHTARDRLTSLCTAL